MFDILANRMYESVPDVTFIDIGSAMILTMLLVIVDVFLRLLIEATRYNEDMGKPGTVLSITLTMVWRGWGLTRCDGKAKRYMMSKGFRNGLAKKMLLQYPGFFLFAILVYIYPDYCILGVRVDETMSIFLLSLPVLCEMMSIVENLNEIDRKNINALAKIFTWLSKLKG